MFCYYFDVQQKQKSQGKTVVKMSLENHSAGRFACAVTVAMTDCSFRRQILVEFLADV